MMISGPGSGSSYSSWANCGAGSSVTTRTRREMSEGFAMVMSSTTTLLSVHPDKVRLEMVMTMQVTGAPVAMPYHETRHVWDIPATFEPTPDFERVEETPDGGEVSVSKRSWPAPADDPTYREGDEVLEIAGRRVSCRWNERTVELQGRRIRFRAWLSDQIPGGLARTETRVEGNPSEDTDMVVTAFDRKKPTPNSPGS